MTKTKNNTAENFSSFEELWAEHSPKIRRYCYNWLNGCIDNINDAMSLAREKAYRYSLNQKEPIENYFSWLYRLTYNICIDIHRASARQMDIVDQVNKLPNSFFFSAKTSESLDEQMSREHLYDNIMESINQMPEDMKLVIKYRFVEELDYEQMASLLNINQANVRKKVQLARQRLRGEVSFAL